MIREMRETDIPRLKSLENGFSWEFGTDFLGALVYVDSEDKVVMLAGSWAVAEVHMVCDASWKTPHARLLAMQEMQAAMRAYLKPKGIRRALTFMDDMKDFAKVLVRRLGWIRSESTSFHQEV